MSEPTHLPSGELALGPLRAYALERLRSLGLDESRADALAEMGARAASHSMAVTGWPASADAARSAIDLATMPAPVALADAEASLAKLSRPARKKRNDEARATAQKGGD
jgi:hypothetical protein